MGSPTPISDDRDKRALQGWRILWIGTLVCYFVYGAYQGDLGVPYGPLLGAAICTIIWARLWIVSETRWFYYNQTCMQAGILMTVVQLLLIGHNSLTVMAPVPLVLGVGTLLAGWYAILRKPRLKRIPY